MKEQRFRSPSKNERQILAKLLELPFRGRAELVQQMEGLRVKQIDEDGSKNKIHRSNGYEDQFFNYHNSHRLLKGSLRIRSVALAAGILPREWKRPTCRRDYWGHR